MTCQWVTPYTRSDVDRVKVNLASLNLWGSYFLFSDDNKVVFWIFQVVSYTQTMTVGILVFYGATKNGLKCKRNLYYSLICKRYGLTIVFQQKNKYQMAILQNINSWHLNFFNFIYFFYIWYLLVWQMMQKIWPTKT